MTLHFGSWTIFTFSIVLLVSLHSTQVFSLVWLLPTIAILILNLVSKLSITMTKLGFGLFLGLSIATIHMQIFTQKVESLHLHRGNITILAEVDSFFTPTQHGFQGDIRIHSINNVNLFWYQKPKVKLRTTSVVLKPGQHWEMTVASKPVFGLLNEAGFDLEKHFVASGLHGIAVLDENHPALLLKTENLRSKYYTLISDAVSDYQAQGLILALTFAERSKISVNEWKNLKSSGIAHLIAISGLHIAIAFSMGYFIGVLIRLGLPTKVWMPIIGGLTVAWIYAWLAGFSLSTIRALILCITLSFTHFIGVCFSGWRRLGIALFCILIFDPFSIYSAAFWLSFGAVACIYLSLISHNSTILVTWFKVQASLLIGLLPIMAFFFGGFAPAAPIYNALYIPIFSLILVPALFISLIGQGLSHYFSLQLDMNLLWQFIDWLLTILLDLTSYSQFWWVSVSKAALLMFVLFSICIVMRLFTPWAALLLIVLPLTELLDDEENNSWTLTVLDVGHGLAVLIEKNESFWLFDTGASWDSGSMVHNVISPVLHHRGAKDLETAIFSHADNDHAGGREDLIAQWNPQRLISPQWHLGNTRCVSGQNWEWHGLDIRVLWPEKLVPRAYNPHSCVVKVSDGKHSVLLTGDIDAVSEYLLYHKQYDQLDSDIILVPHHGSNTSSRTKFIQAVSPQIAIASLAKSGRWRLPSTSVVERYQAQGAIWMDTATSGQITVNLSAEGIHITTQRSKNEDLWFRKRLRWQN